MPDAAPKPGTVVGLLTRSQGQSARKYLCSSDVSLLLIEGFRHATSILGAAVDYASLRSITALKAWPRNLRGPPSTCEVVACKVRTSAEIIQRWREKAHKWNETIINDQATATEGESQLFRRFFFTIKEFLPPLYVTFDLLAINSSESYDLDLETWSFNDLVLL